MDRTLEEWADWLAVIGYDGSKRDDHLGWAGLILKAIDDARKGERGRCAKIIKDFPIDDYNDEQEVDDALSRVMIKILEGTTP